MTADVLAFLRAALDEVERVAGAAARADAPAWEASGNEHVITEDGAPIVVGTWGYLSDELGAHIALHDPRAALARVQAERALLGQLVEMNEGAMGRGEWGDPQVLHESDELIRTLAYGHRHTVPGFDPAWAPEGVSADA